MFFFCERNNLPRIANVTKEPSEHQPPEDSKTPLRPIKSLETLFVDLGSVGIVHGTSVFLGLFQVCLRQYFIVSLKAFRVLFFEVLVI